jgi:hypothetical protein
MSDGPHVAPLRCWRCQAEDPELVGDTLGLCAPRKTVLRDETVPSVSSDWPLP